jgi:hypothetical protein
MRFLVDGFDHLDIISNQIPEGIREAACLHKQNLLAATGMIAGSELNIDDQNRYIFF